MTASWQRSQDHQIPIERGEAPIATEPELAQCRCKYAELVEAARPALQDARTFLADAKSMIMLTDPTGLVLEAVGDPKTTDFGHAVHLEQGGRWQETDIGTNAIGTAIAELKPVQIHGSEHFCENVKCWTCAATPIWHPDDHELMGVVDISGPAKTFNPQSLALAVALGRQIESMLVQSIKCDHERLLRYYLAKHSLWASDDVVAIDRRGRIIYGHENVIQDLERRHIGLISNGRVSSLKNVPPKAWAAQLNGKIPNSDVELVGDRNHEIGAVLVLHKRRRSSVPAQPRLHSERSLTFDEILGESTVMRETRERARRMALTGSAILIEGETGVGKELFARAIHSASPAESSGPFVPVNCGGMPRDLVGSELFGYSKGAFTGAKDQGHAGKIEAADGGLLCLDEIGEMPLDLQPYLLRVLEDGILYRIGSNSALPVLIRLVSMTNRDLHADVDAGRFRRDLYHRIAVMRLSIPPLRDRGDDVVLLSCRFADLVAAKAGRPAPPFDDEVLDLFRRYSWPGNVRQLRNVVENMVLLGNFDRLRLSDVPIEIRQRMSPSVVGAALEQSAVVSPNLKLRERAAIEAALVESGGNLSDAAKRLGIARSTLYRKLGEQAGSPVPKLCNMIDGD